MFKIKSSKTSQRRILFSAYGVSNNGINGHETR